MSLLRALPLALVLAARAAAQQTISFPTDDGGRVCANLYGQGYSRCCARSRRQIQQGELAGPGPRPGVRRISVLAIDFRGFGCSTGPGQADFDNAPFEKDVLAAVRYLKAHGVKTVSVVGGSFGGAAAGDASIKSAPGEIDRIVFLGAAPNLPAEKLKSRALFIVARDDTNGAGLRLPGIRAQYEKAPQPKELIVLDGSAHAQFLFQTDQSARVMQRDSAIPLEPHRDCDSTVRNPHHPDRLHPRTADSPVPLDSVIAVGNALPLDRPPAEANMCPSSRALPGKLARI